MSNLPNFIMVTGLPGSGKSTIIARRYPDYSIHSSDAIREELSGDVNNQNINAKVFNTLHKRVKDDLKSGKNVVYDATNISWKKRKAFLQELSSISCKKINVLIATPFEICIERNNSRERTVPYFVIERMYKNFDIPWYNEGWDEIEVYYTEDSFSSYYGNWLDFLTKYSTFSQESKWHTDTLGEHCRKTLSYVKTNLDHKNIVIPGELFAAAALHDCGKPFCKTFKDSHGNASEFAHYYNHENVGAYDSLFYTKDSATQPLIVAALIRNHMYLHFFKDWKATTIDKYEKEFTGHPYLQGIHFYEALQLLHTGDKKAH